MDKKKNQWKAWLYLLPALVILAIFTVWPIINTVRMSLLKNYDGLSQIGGETFEFGFYQVYQKNYADHILPSLRH